MAQQQQQPKGDFMPKVDLEKDKKFLSQAQLDYMRLAQQQNAERVNRLKKIRRTNLITAGILGTSVFAIFGYSMWAVGSEKFLDEFDEKPSPPPPSQTQKQ